MTMSSSSGPSTEDSEDSDCRSSASKDDGHRLLLSIPLAASPLKPHSTVMLERGKVATVHDYFATKWLVWQHTCCLHINIKEEKIDPPSLARCPSSCLRLNDLNWKLHGPADNKEIAGFNMGGNAKTSWETT